MQGGAFDLYGCLGTAYEMSGSYQNRRLCTQTLYHGGMLVECKHKMQYAAVIKKYEFNRFAE